MRTGWFYILAVTLLVWVPQSALAERHAIVVGVNQGPSPLVPLRYAHDDARKIEEILRELGGVPKSNMRLLLEPDLEELQSMLWTTTSAAKPGDELFFYYSGHADDQGLLLHNERFPQAELRALLDDNRFQVRVAVIDACKSGSFTREKGGSFGPPIDFDWALDSETKGAVLITSSSAEEASVERDDLGGSLFTHFWASALRGAADHNNDAQVTLSEAFAFAYEKTLVRSADSRSGIQHPNYDYEIKGRDELTLTNLAGGARLIFPESTLGTYLVFHRARGSLVAELEKVLDEEKQLHLPPGDYVIKKRIKNASLLLTASIGSVDNYIVEDSSMKTLPLTDDLSKGYETPIFEPTWKHGAPFTKFTAHTLRQGEWVAGLQSVQYGISDDVTIYTLPLTALFGLPLFGVELNLLKSSQWIWSIGFSTIQSLPKSSSPRGWHETRLETTLTYQPIPDIQLSVLSGWALESGPDEALDTKPWEFQKFIVGGSVTWTPLDWFFLQVSTKDSTFFYGTERLEVGLLQSEAILGLAWGAWRISGGIISGAEHIFEDTNALQPSFDLWVRW